MTARSSEIYEIRAVIDRAYSGYVLFTGVAKWLL